MFFDRIKQFFAKDQAVETLDLVEEFRRDLGLSVGKKKGGNTLVRIIRSAHAWTETDSVVYAIAAALVAIFVAITITTNTIVAIFVVIMGAGMNCRTGMQAFYTFFVEVAGIAIVGLFLGHPFVSSLPLLTVSAFYFWNGIRMVYQTSNSPEGKTTEQRIAEVFDSFVTRHKPEFLGDSSKLNVALATVSRNIAQLADIKTRFEAELMVDRERGGKKAVVIEEKIAEIERWTKKLYVRQKETDTAKAEILQGLQIFEAIKGDATAYVRLDSLSTEADRILGTASSHIAHADEELFRIRRQIVSTLHMMNEAAAKLGFAAVAKLDDPSLQLLESGVEEIHQSTKTRDKRIRLVSGE